MLDGLEISSKLFLERACIFSNKVYGTMHMLEMLEVGKNVEHTQVKFTFVGVNRKLFVGNRTQLVKGLTAHNLCRD